MPKNKIIEKLLPRGSKRHAAVKKIISPVISFIKGMKKQKITFDVVTHEEGLEIFKNCERVGIIATEHTMYNANIIGDCLSKFGLKPEIHINSVDFYEDIPYIIICPQFLKKFPRLYVVVQMEQTVSDRWLTPNYLEILHNAYAVFDYSYVNIDYFSKDFALAPKLYYLPVDCSKNPIVPEYDGKKEYDVLFYGAAFVERRQKILDSLKSKHNVHIICDKFGTELYKEMQKAKVVINIHYYANALLETTRIYETLSVGSSIIVSERSSDPKEEKRLENIVDFVDVGDVDALCDRVGFWLSHDEEREAKVKENNKILAERMNALEFYLGRFLLDNKRISQECFEEKFGKTTDL